MIMMSVVQNSQSLRLAWGIQFQWTAASIDHPRSRGISAIGVSVIRNDIQYQVSQLFFIFIVFYFCNRTNAEWNMLLYAFVTFHFQHHISHEMAPWTLQVQDVPPDLRWFGLVRAEAFLLDEVAMSMLWSRCRGSTLPKFKGQDGQLGLWRGQTADHLKWSEVRWLKSFCVRYRYRRQHRDLQMRYRKWTRAICGWEGQGVQQISELYLGWNAYDDAVSFIWIITWLK